MQTEPDIRPAAWRPLREGESSWQMKEIPVIDLFAGPGGLGEGFSSFGVSEFRPFKIRLSIEKDYFAHKTLELRSFYRQFCPGQLPKAYYEYLRKHDCPEDVRRNILFGEHPEEARKARNEAWHAELGRENTGKVRRRINAVLDGNMEWVLVGGPPCQAYSIAGRARNSGNIDYIPENDERQYLYIEYLQIIADHRPAVFVMENVKGLLSATLQDQHVFERIYEDLQEPARALRRERRSIRNGNSSQPKRSAHYRLYSLVKPGESDKQNLSDFVVCMENHGVPQARHRVIILGVRDDFTGITPKALKQTRKVNTRRVLMGLPSIRSGLSYKKDCSKEWREQLRKIVNYYWFRKMRSNGFFEISARMIKELEKVRCPWRDKGGEFIPYNVGIDYRQDWFLDYRIGGVCNHISRTHMLDDLYRYFFAACFAKVRRRSPLLRDFPEDLLPEHANAIEATMGSYMFADRFRVQLNNKPATTITSHISRDGHYYIHPDPAQCRSLTVREAARLQTFPDNYFFCGPRTQQFVQVGNAVPPLLAHQIAEIIYDLLKQAGVSE